VCNHSESQGQQHLYVAVDDDNNDINKNDSTLAQFITKQDKAHYVERTESTCAKD
jgi:hypothetical protein